MATPFPPRLFGDLAGNPTAKALHKFINQPGSVTKLIESSEMGRPAVEGILKSLSKQKELKKGLANPPRQALHYRYRQCIGKIVKEVLEEQGWEVGTAAYDRQVKIDPEIREEVELELGYEFIKTGARYTNTRTSPGGGGASQDRQ